MGKPAKVVSVEREARHGLPEYSWEELSEPGTYVEKETGDLYRIPRELLIQGAPPLIAGQAYGFPDWFSSAKILL